METKNLIPPFGGMGLNFGRSRSQPNVPTQTFWQCYSSTGRVIGSDSFSQLFIGSKRSSGETVFIKKLRRNSRDQLDAQQTMKREISVLRLLSWTEGICHLHGRVHSPNAIALDPIDGVALTNYPSSMRGTEIITLLKLAKILSDVHELGLLHRALGYDSALVAKSGAPSLTNFGFSSSLGEISFQCSPPDNFLQFFAPELFESVVMSIDLEQTTGSAAFRFNNSESNHQTEIYALGLIAYRILTGADAYSSPVWNALSGESANLTRAIQHARRLHNNNVPNLDSSLFVSPHAMSLVAAMLEKDPANRPASVREIQQFLEKIV